MEKTNSVIEFLYNADGIRTSKTVNGVEHVYTLNGSQIVSEAWLDRLLIYLYDESGSPIGMQYRTSSYAADVFDTFYFEKNLQGDIIAIYTESGRKILEYTYDAWGNHSVTWTYLTMETLPAGTNPFRYRGYYYDTDTQLYYLQSRYYNPAWGRFLNADGYVNANGNLIGFNMYAYCSNNPVMYTDPSGQLRLGIIDFLSDGLTDMQDAFASFMDGTLNFMQTLTDALVVDIGFGAGIGLGAEVGGFEGKALIRSDFLTVRKDAGENSLFYRGRAEVQCLSMEGLSCVMESGKSEFIYADGYCEEIPVAPHINTTLSVGCERYLGIGITISIGLDWDYILTAICIS